VTHYRAREAFREHPERAVDEAVYKALLAHFTEWRIERQYRGWKRDDSTRAALIPDFLLIRGDRVLIVEVKAKRATSADARKVLRYIERAWLMEWVGEVSAAIVAPSFSRHIPPEIQQWPYA
jgi:hypothetical protein